MTGFRARHSCGTEIEDELPEGYPVEEGVGLWCPACEEAFWHRGEDPDPAPFLPPQPAELAPVSRRRWRHSS